MSRARIRRHGLAAAALALAAAAAVAGEPGPRERLLEGLERLRDPAAPPVAEVAGPLAADAAAGVDLLVEVLLEDRLPVEPGARAFRLGLHQRELALALLAGLPRAAVLESLDAGLADPDGARRRLGALDVLGVAGGRTQMSAYFEHAEAAAAALSPLELEPALERSLAALLARDEGARSWLTTRWRHLEPALLPPVLRAVGAAGHPDGLELLLDVIEGGNSASLDAMAQVPRLVPARTDGVDAALREALRARLDPQDAAGCRAALHALGELEDAGSVAVWIELLEAEDAGLRGDALWALRRLSGLRLTADPADWRRWHAEERRWFAADFERAAEALCGVDPAAAAAALNELSRHGLERARIARAVTEALRHPAPGVRALACRLLEQLARAETRPALEAALADPEPDVRAAAEGALARLGA